MFLESFPGVSPTQDILKIAATGLLAAFAVWSILIRAAEAAAMGTRAGHLAAALLGVTGHSPSSTKEAAERALCFGHEEQSSNFSWLKQEKWFISSSNSNTEREVGQVQV